MRPKIKELQTIQRQEKNEAENQNRQEKNEKIKELQTIQRQEKNEAANQGITGITDNTAPREK